MQIVNEHKIKSPSGSRFLSLNDLLQLIRPIRGRLIIACILEAISAVASVIPFIAVAELARVLLQEGPINADLAWRASWIAFAALAIRISFSYAAYMITHFIDNVFLYQTRSNIAKRLVRVPLGWFTSRSAGEVKKAMSDDVAAMHFLISHAALDMITAVVVPVITIIYLFSISWIMAIAAMFPLLIGIVLFARQVNKGLKHMDTYNQSMGQISSSAIEFVQGISVVKTFGQAGRAHKRFLSSVEDFLNNMWAMLKSSLRVATLGELFLTPLAALVTIVAAATLSVQYGWMAPSVVIPFTLLGLGITSPMLAIWNGGIAAQEAATSAKRVKAMLETPVLSEPNPKNKPQHQTLEFINVGFSYSDKIKALHNISFKLEPGTSTALVGRSGSGKSTIAKLIPRFWDPSEGKICLGGIDIRDISTSELFNQISFVFQEVQLLKASVRENIAMAKQNATTEEIIGAAKAANIHERILELPMGYDSILGEDAQFSGGEAQRISIARAILADTPILVMDEATAFADPESEALIQDALSKLTEGRTLLVIAHRLSTIQYVDQIIVLDRGTIKEQGSHEQLLKENGLYAKLWNDYDRSTRWKPSTGTRNNLITKNENGI